MKASPSDLHRRGVEAANSGRYGVARRLLERAGAQTDDADLRARIAGTTAYIMARTGDLPGAEALCRTALATGRLGPETVGVLAGQLGALAERAGRLDEAVRWLGRGIDAVAPGSIAAARMKVNRSLVRMQLRRLDEAAADLGDAAAVYAARDLPVDEAQVRHNIGYLALLGGELVPALEAMLAARRVLAAESAVSAAIGDVDRAEVLRDAGLTTEAERILERAAATFGAHRMPQSRAETEFALARSLLAHDPTRAARVAAGAARRLRALGNDVTALRADAVAARARLSGGGILPSGAGRVAEPRRRPRPDEIDDLAAALVRAGFAGDAAALRMTHELWRTRHPRSSASPTEPGVRMPRRAAMDVLLLVHQVRAESAAGAGRDALARRHAGTGLDALGAWQERFGSLDLQTSLAAHGGGLVYAGLAAAVRSGRPDVVFEWSERARHLSQRVVPLRPPRAPDEADELAEFRLLRSADPAGDRLATAGAAAVQERLRARQWSQTGAAGIQARLDLPAVRGALGEATALVAYVFTGTGLAAVAATRDGVRLVVLAGWPRVRQALSGLRADLDMSAAVRGGPLADRIRRSLADRLGVLSQLILDPVIDVTGPRHLVLTVPGVLGGLPWGMLPSMRGRAFTLALSATRWARSREAHTTPARAGFAAGPRVARAAEEVGAAASAWPVATVLAEARVVAVEGLAGDVDLLHVAAHGRHAVENPLFSGLELHDGTLFGYDVDRMPRVPATVVLSACEVGRSTVRGGEEAIGMTRVWLHAGTRCVIAAPVVVDDDAACELLAAMHGGLAAGLAPAVALAAASEQTGRVTPFQAYGSGI